MSERLASLLILGALVLGYPLGLAISKFAPENQIFARICGLVGAAMTLVGLTGDGGIRYLILAEAGLYLQFAFLVASFKFKRVYKPQYQELWASHREPNHPPVPTLASGTSAARQEPRHR